MQLFMQVDRGHPIFIPNLCIENVKIEKEKKAEVRSPVCLRATYE